MKYKGHKLYDRCFFFSTQSISDSGGIEDDKVVNYIGIL